MEKRYLGLKELAQYIGVAEGTIYSWVCYRKIPHFKRFRLLKFDKQAIDAWMNEKLIEEIK